MKKSILYKNFCYQSISCLLDNPHKESVSLWLVATRFLTSSNSFKEIICLLGTRRCTPAILYVSAGLPSSSLDSRIFVVLLFVQSADWWLKSMLSSLLASRVLAASFSIQKADGEKAWMSSLLDSRIFAASFDQSADWRKSVQSGWLPMRSDFTLSNSTCERKKL